MSISQRSLADPSLVVKDRRQTQPEARPWTRRAACAGKTSLFFAAASERPETRVVRELKASLVCASCPVATPCREWAREHREYGFWGGESEEMRAAAGFQARLPRVARRPRRINPHRVA
jgi:WhiB family redox-sensing transcriptional regulator